ncbi:adhesion G protein-coupled receptor E5 [Halyomorpha halys]|uniref:adhesion G protein-coupled receptor E5 n=1 Tax=Halyomorpha halys TaxID=286706 RepID=UPI0006D528B9|nr:adhesion G protein-coupled receptor L2-like [Halyomorpha halys]
MTQQRISARWLLLYTLNVSMAAGEAAGGTALGTVHDIVQCGPDVKCKGKDPKNNPEYFKPSMGNLRRCYCDNECVEYGDCCVDRAPFPYSRNENITWSCVAKSYNQTLYAVSNCMVKGQWNELCEKKFYVPYIEYLSDLPVYSNHTGLYYANAYCAFCDQRLWLKYGFQLPHYFTRPRLITQCTPKINLNMLKAEGKYQYGRLLWKVRDGYCSIFQDDKIKAGRPCLPSIASCPDSADQALSAVCAAYSQLLSINNTVFRNPHCAICNGVNQEDSFCKYEEPNYELDGLTYIFGLNWFLDGCEESMYLRDNLRNECKSINCNVESGQCQINKCTNSCDLNGDLVTSGYVIYVCLSASIICLLIHVYRAIFISPPKNLPSRIINSLAWSLLVTQTLFLTSIYSLVKLPHHSNLCYITAVIIQYFFLASFLWMSVISFDIWFTFSNTFKLFSTSYRKYALYAWGVTGLIILVSVIIDQTDFFPSKYRPKYGPTNNSCWLGSYSGLALYLGVPIGFVLFLNTIFFIMTICLFRKQQSCVSAISGRKEYSLLLLYVKISSVIGMTWVATLTIMIFNSKPNVNCVLSVINSLQGAFIFIMFNIKTDAIFTYVKVILHRIFGSH